MFRLNVDKWTRGLSPGVRSAFSERGAETMDEKVLKVSLLLNVLASLADAQTGDNHTYGRMNPRKSLNLDVSSMIPLV